VSGMFHYEQQTETPVGYPPETVMTRQQLAGALSTSEDSIERSKIPVSYALGPRNPRYVWGDVVEWIRKGVAA
jgi:hypothetical protein